MDVADINAVILLLFLLDKLRAAHREREKTYNGATGNKTEWLNQYNINLVNNKGLDKTSQWTFTNFPAGT